MSQNWEDVWSRRGGNAAQSGDTLQALVELDGFDAGAGRIGIAEWRSHAKSMALRLKLAAGESVYEIGCGAGAFLYALREQGISVSGMDYSNSLISAARRAMPEALFDHGEARFASVLPQVSVVLANSVFHYFPDEAYAAEVLDRMLRKATRAVAVLEVPDLDRRAESEARRRDILSVEEYEKKYRGLEHLYLSRGWFSQKVAALGYHCEIFDQCVPGYAQNEFRFNCIIQK